MEIEALYDGVDFSETLTRARFEELNADLFKNTLGPVKQVLEDSGLKKNQVADGKNVKEWHAIVDFLESHMVVSKNRGTTKNGWFIMENPI